MVWKRGNDNPLGFLRCMYRCLALTLDYTRKKMPSHLEQYGMNKTDRQSQFGYIVQQPLGQESSSPTS